MKDMFNEYDRDWCKVKCDDTGLIYKRIPKFLINMMPIVDAYPEELL